MSSVKRYDVKGKYNIKIYMGNYDKKDFYGQMGEFFAERDYRKKLPYLINDIDKIWYLVYDRDHFVGFFGIKICVDNTLISDIYIGDNCNHMEVFKYMAEYLVDLYQEEKLKVLTRVEAEQNIWRDLGFEVVGSRGNYMIMFKEGIKCPK